MWKNLKIVAKLSLGFGLILLVFMASVWVMRSYIKIVDDTGNFMTDRIAPSLELSVQYSREAQECFMMMRLIQFTETKEAMANFNNQLTKVEKLRDEIIALNKMYPELQAPDYVVKTVLPLADQYMDFVRRRMALIEKKQGLLQLFKQAGENTSTAAGDLLTELHKHMKNRIQYNAGPSEANALTDAMEVSARLLENAMSIRRDVWQAMSALSGEKIDDMHKITDSVQIMRKQAESLQSFFNSPEAKKTMERLLSELASYEANLNDFVSACVELDQLGKAAGPTGAAYNDGNSAAVVNAVSGLKEILKTNKEGLNKVLLVMSVSSAIVILLGIIIVIFITRSISKPLQTISNLVKRIGDGDLTVKKEDFRYNGKDEMGHVITVLADMVKTQSSAMTSIVDIAGSLMNEADSMASVSEETNTAMEEIRQSVNHASELSEANSSSLKESSSGVEEMSSGANTVAQSATDSAAFIAQTTEASNKAIQAVQDVIAGMRDVEKNSKESEEKTRQLVTSVENVSSFVSVITGIADQTNLLALNAAIEAARAGEVGRGFAVVADEVRKLAEESASAAQNVNEIIRELQAGARASIESTTEAGRLLGATLDHAVHAVDDLSSALGQMRKANDSIQNIAAVAEEQAASSKEAAIAIDSAASASRNLVSTLVNIHRATDETTQSTNKVAAQAETMTTHAQTLTDLLSAFKLEASPLEISPNLRLH